MSLRIGLVAISAATFLAGVLAFGAGAGSGAGVFAFDGILTGAISAASAASFLPAFPISAFTSAWSFVPLRGIHHVGLPAFHAFNASSQRIYLGTYFILVPFYLSALQHGNPLVGKAGCFLVEHDFDLATPNHEIFQCTHIVP